MNKPIVLIGKSGAGKDTIAKALKSKGFDTVISFTSRPPRDGEVSGIDYNFVSKEQFLDMIKNEELLEYRSYNTLVNNEPDVWYYGTPKLNNYLNKIIVVDPQGLLDIKKHIDVISFYIFLYDETREERAKSRGSFDKTEWDRRLKDDEIKFDDAISITDYTIINDDLSEAVSTILEFYK